MMAQQPLPFRDLLGADAPELTVPGPAVSGGTGSVPEVPSANSSSPSLQTANLGWLMELVNGLVSQGAVTWSHAESIFMPTPGFAQLNIPVDLSSFNIAFAPARDPILTGDTELGAQLLAATEPVIGAPSSTATTSTSTTAVSSPAPVSVATSSSSSVRWSKGTASGFRPIGSPIKLSARGTSAPVTERSNPVRVTRTVTQSHSSTSSAAKRKANGDPVFDERANAILGVQPVYVPRLFQPEQASHAVPPVLAASTVGTLATSEHGSTGDDTPVSLSLVPRTDNQTAEDLAWCLRWLGKAHFNDASALVGVLQDLGCALNLLRIVLRACSSSRRPSFAMGEGLGVQVAMVYNALVSLARQSSVMWTLDRTVRVDIRNLRKLLHSSFYATTAPGSIQPIREVGKGRASAPVPGAVYTPLFLSSIRHPSITTTTSSNPVPPASSASCNTSSTSQAPAQAVLPQTSISNTNDVLFHGAGGGVLDALYDQGPRSWSGSAAFVPVSFT